MAQSHLHLTNSAQVVLFLLFSFSALWHHPILHPDQFGPQRGQQAIDIGEAAPLTIDWRLQNAAYDHRLVRSAKFNLATDDEIVINHRIGFHEYSITIERQSNANQTPMVIF